MDITKQPVGGTFAQGATVRLYVQASASGGVLAYEWHRVSAAGADVVVGASSSICDDTTSPAPGSYTYYVKVTNTGADGSALSKQSSGAAVNVVAGSLATSVQNGNFSYTGSPIDRWFYTESQVVPWKTTHNKAVGSTPAKVIEMANSNNPYGVTGDPNRWCAELAASSPSCLYQEVATVPGKLFSWSLDHAARGGREVMALVVAPALTTAESQALGYTNAEYPYGENISTYFNAILNKVAEDKSTTVDALELGEYATTYQGRPCYVRVIADNKDNHWHTHTGTFTVPEGQGRTVFGFAAALTGNAHGNLLSKVSFAAGGGITANSDVGYKGDGSLSVDTQAGYSYGIVEERGSAVLPVANVTFADGAAAPAPYDGGWIASTSVSKLVFGNLTPGKTYRVVGVPTNAAGDVLGLNAKPANVLDEQYYDSFIVKAVSGGSSSSVGNVQIQATVDAVTKKAAILVEPTRADVDYALLACPDGTTASADAANPVVAWTQGTGAQLRFEGLERGASYLVVARPHGYFEVGYADAVDSGVIIVTPGMDFRDVGTADVERTASAASSIVVKNTSTDQVYCVYNVATGARQANQMGTGAPLTFAGLDAGAAYQVVTAPSGSVFSQGVRSYPAAPALAVDFAGEQAGTGADGTGAVSTEVEYRLQATDGDWLYGGDTAWVAGTGGQAVPLADALQRMTEHNSATATLTYRLKGDADVASVSIESQVAVPARPAFSSASCSLSFTNETLVAQAGGAGIDVSADGWKSHTSLAAGSATTLSTLGWNGAAKTLSVRTQATASAFASVPGDVAVPARPAAPTSADASLTVNEVAHTASLSNKSASVLEYRAQGAADTVAWTPVAAGVTASNIALPASSAFTVRFAAVEGASFASRTYTLSASTASLDVSAPDVVDLVYGYDATSYVAKVSVRNSGTDAATVTGVAVTGDITFTGPATSGTVAPGATNDTTWTISPKPGLAAGSYEASIAFSYTGGSTDATVYQAVHEFTFIVAKADQAAPTSVTVEEISDTTATVAAALPAGSVAGAALEYSDDGRTWVDAPAFTGLSAASDYTFSARVKESANHYASAAATVAARTAHATPDASALSVNYIDETMTYAASAFEVSTTNVSSPAAGDLLASGSSVSDYAGTTLYIRAKETSAAGGVLATPASPWRAVALPARPAAPSATALPAYSSQRADGTISVPGAVEFAFRAAGSEGSWTTVPAAFIGGRAAGAYEVRIPATAVSFASASAAVTVGVQYAFVTFEADGGVPAPVQQTVQVAQADGTPVIAHATDPGTPVKSGFTFAGWFAPGATASWSFATDVVTSDVTLAAHWSEVLHAVTYYLNDGATVDPYHVDASVRWDSLLSAPAEPTRGGYAFGGWWTSADGGVTLDTLWDFEHAAMPAEDLALYAKWTPVFQASVPVSLQGSVSAADGTVALPGAASYRILSKTPVALSVASVAFTYAAAEAGDPLIASGRSNVTFTVNGLDVAGAKAGIAVVPGAGAAPRFVVPPAVWTGATCAEGVLGLELSMALNGATVRADAAATPFATLAFSLAMDESGV